MEKVAIVILNWNGQAMMERYLPSVLNYSRDEAAVYVADNASTDQSMEMLRRQFPEVLVDAHGHVQRDAAELSRNASNRPCGT